MDANQNRKEYKFVLSPRIGELMREEVSQHLAADRDFHKGYPVLSEYYDTDERASYWQKQFGVPNRRRVRTRVYGEEDGCIPSTAFIEVKHKLNGTTVKRRVLVGLDEVAEFSSGKTPIQSEYSEVADQRVVQEIESIVKDGECRPVVQIRYHRYAYDSGTEGKIRITFDTELLCRFECVPLTPGDPNFELPLLETGASIMEVKTIGPVPYWFRKLLGQHQLVPRGYSKYATALELYEFKHSKSQDRNVELSAG